MIGSAAVRFLVGAGTSFYGDWLTTVALVVLLYRLTGSPTGPAVYVLARVAPRIAGPLPGGALADRFGPARIASSCAAAQALLAIGIVLLAQHKIVWAIYVTVAASQFLNSLAQPCLGALVPRVATPARLGRVQGVYSALLSSSILVSPAIGALLLPLTTPELLIALDAVSFVIAAAMLTTLLDVGGPSTSSERIRGMGVGIRIVIREPMLRFLATAYVSNAAAVTALQAVLVVAAAQQFGHDVLVGWLYAAVGAGGLVGTLPVIRSTPKHVGLSPIVAASMLELAPLAVFVFVKNLPIAMLLLFVSSLGASLYQTRGDVGLQQRIPREVMGRVMAVIRLALYGGMLLGAIAATAFVQLLGWQATVLVVCVGGGAVLFVAAVSEASRPPSS